MELTEALDVMGATDQSILVTLKKDGHPQLSNVLHQLDDTGVFRISITTDRAKYHNVRRDPWVALHANGTDFQSYVVIEGRAVPSPPAADPHDDTVEALVAWYRALAGEHPDWDDFRAAMVAERRVLLGVHPERAYGLIRPPADPR